MFYRMPFNFCDRWCERCELGAICKVRQKELLRKEKYLKAGEDPYLWKAVFGDIYESFAEVGKMLAKDLKRLGITQEEIDKQPLRKEPNPTRFKTYQIAHKLSIRIRKYLEDISWLIEEKDDQVIDSAEILLYYNNFIVAKIFRAILSREEEKDMPGDTTMDAKNSAFLTSNALTEMGDALQDMFASKQLKNVKKETGQLIILIDSLNEIVLTEFGIEAIPDFH